LQFVPHVAGDSRVLRHRHWVSGGALVNFGRQRWCDDSAKKSAAARAAKFSDFTYFFQKFFSFCYQGMHVEGLFLAVVRPQIGKKYYKNRPSVTKGCKPSRLN